MDLIERLRSFVVERGKIACGSDIVSACNNSALSLSDLRALLAALEAVREDGWQPIEAAPKDGNCLLAIETDDGYTFGVLERFEDGTWVHEGEPTFCKAYYFMPTHWMPLPAPPKEARNG